MKSSIRDYMQASPNTRHIFWKLANLPQTARIFSDFLPVLAEAALPLARPSLPWPGKSAQKSAVIPVFLPFSGCRTRCVFCSQPGQTGISAPEGPAGVRAILAKAQINLEEATQKGKTPAELAFYGGTFTAQERESLEICLDFAEKMLQAGKINSFRCSTRPDCLDESILAELAARGCRLVELGIQSFADAALKKSARGYTGAVAEKAAGLVKKSGLGLGVQLMPGMPGQKDAAFIADVARAISLDADCLRFYPCQVIEGTALADLWKRGVYRPWPLRLTLRRLAQGLLLANVASVPVIRMGLAPQPGLAMLAGPWHPALGSMVQARALMLAALLLAGQGGLAGASLHLPRSARGYAAGHRGAAIPLWARLGLDFANLNFDADSGIWLERP